MNSSEFKTDLYELPPTRKFYVNSTICNIKKKHKFFIIELNVEKKKALKIPFDNKYHPWVGCEAKSFK